MNDVTRKEMLQGTLTNIPESPFTVTSIRDQILTLYPDCKYSTSSMRRWVHGTFKTLIKQGVIIPFDVSTARNKTYTLKSWNIPVNKAEPSTNEGLKSSTTVTAAEKSKNLNTELTNQITSYHRTLNIQLGEISEYQRLMNEHPSLKSELERKCVQLTEENHRLLGRLKAIEEAINIQRIK